MVSTCCDARFREPDWPDTDLCSACGEHAGAFDDEGLDCGRCGAQINLGDSFQYETTGYTPYCDNTTCTEGIATVGSCLEDCWWG
jgi:hypothetical protein